MAITMLTWLQLAPSLPNPCMGRYVACLPTFKNSCPSGPLTTLTPSEVSLRYFVSRASGQAVKICQSGGGETCGYSERAKGSGGGAPGAELLGYLASPGTTTVWLPSRVGGGAKPLLQP